RKRGRNLVGACVAASRLLLASSARRCSTRTGTRRPSAAARRFKCGGNVSLMRRFALAACLLAAASFTTAAPAPAQTKPEGEMRFAVYVTLAPAWLDPGEAQPGFVTPF